MPWLVIQILKTAHSPLNRTAAWCEVLVLRIVSTCVCSCVVWLSKFYVPNEAAQQPFASLTSKQWLNNIKMDQIDKNKTSTCVRKTFAKAKTLKMNRIIQHQRCANTLYIAKVRSVCVLAVVLYRYPTQADENICKEAIWAIIYSVQVKHLWAHSQNIKSPRLIAAGSVVYITHHQQFTTRIHTNLAHRFFSPPTTRTHFTIVIFSCGSTNSFGPYIHHGFSKCFSYTHDC